MTMAAPARPRAQRAQPGFQSFVETQRLLGKLEKETAQLTQDAHDRLHELRLVKKDLRRLLRMVNRTVWIATIGTTFAGAIFTLIPMMIPNDWQRTIHTFFDHLTNDTPPPSKEPK